MERTLVKAGTVTDTPLSKIRIALVQCRQRVGDLDANAAAMLEWRATAAAEGAELVLFPEMQLPGYPCEDLVLKPEFVRRTMDAAERLVDATAGGGPAMLIGTMVRSGFVDHTPYDTTSILKFVTRRFGLEPLPGVRAKAGDLIQALQP